VRAFVETFTGYDAQCAQGQQVDDAGDAVQRISPNTEVGSECYLDEVMQGASEQIVEALEEGTARFDASDLMPAAVGSGSFWDGMNEWMRGADLDQVLPEIDAAWPN
jgi:alpha-glucoside transport system substrate-binding protein